MLLIDGKRLFAQDMLAVFQAKLTVLVVHGVGRGNIDRLHLRVSGKSFIRAIVTRNRILQRKSLRAVQMP